MINRREFVGITAAAGASLAFPAELLRAFEQSGRLIHRAIPSSGEMLPVVSFGPRPTGPAVPGEIKPEATDVPAAKEVLKTLLDRGGRVVDVLHGGPPGEQAARTAANELGIQDRFFWTTPLAVNGVLTLPGAPRPKPDPAAVRAAMEAKFAALKVPKIDLVMVGGGGDPTHLAVLREMKKEGRIRYLGVHGLLPPANAPIGAVGAQFESIMRNEEIDFVGTDYSVGDRRVEEKLLPLAIERKIGFLAYFTFDRGRIFKRTGGTPLPEWAAEFDAKTWAQFFIKYVISHPAVVMARTGTTKAAHMLDNIGGGIGSLPNEAMRKRMAELMDTFPPTPAAVASPQLQQQLQATQTPKVVLSAAILDRYVGEYTHVAAGTNVTVRRDGERLLVKVQGSFPEGPLVALSETRFGTPWPGGTIEFQLDAQGKVIGGVAEGVGGSRFLLERK